MSFYLSLAWVGEVTLFLAVVKFWKKKHPWALPKWSSLILEGLAAFYPELKEKIGNLQNIGAFEKYVCIAPVK